MLLDDVPRSSGRHRPDAAPFATDQQQLVDRRSDRDLQDSIIRYLTDTPAQSISGIDCLDEHEQQKARRFSRFLARRYYRDRLHRGFHYSSGLLAASDSAHEIVNTPQFESVLDDCVLGSLTTSEDVGQLAVARLSHLSQESWWKELLQYEFAFFLQLATSEVSDPSPLPIKNTSAIVCHFQIRIPELLSLLKAGHTGSSDLDGETTLLFSRASHGKIYVAEIDEKTAAVYAAVTNTNCAINIAHSCSLPMQEIQRILATLADIGAVVLPAASILESAD
jgi:hypothetical protein